MSGRLLADHGLYPIASDEIGMAQSHPHGHNGFVAVEEPAPNPPVALPNESNHAFASETDATEGLGHTLDTGHQPVARSSDAIRGSILSRQPNQKRDENCFDPSGR